MKTILNLSVVALIFVGIYTHNLGVSGAAIIGFIAGLNSGATTIIKMIIKDIENEKTITRTRRIKDK